ncbi:MAG: LuxR C-terminal-related transcriptional regulator [Cyanobacteria bacterium P01_A01_bin.105]
MTRSSTPAPHAPARPVPTAQPIPTPSPHHSFFLNQVLKAAIDNLVDGLMIVTAHGEILQQNTVAVEMCASLPGGSGGVSPDLWAICQPIFQNLARGVKPHLGLEVDLLDSQQYPLRVRVQILDLTTQDRPCLLLVLEDRQATYHRQALVDASRFGLTPREREVWELRLKGTSYDAIAAQLWITTNTVKKHMKSILAKRRLYQDGVSEIAS